MTALPVLSGGSIGVYIHVNTQENPVFPHCFCFQINPIADLIQHTLQSTVLFSSSLFVVFLLSDLTTKPSVTCTSRHCKGFVRINILH